MGTELDATTLAAAYKKWAVFPLETLTSMRLELAKFFFSVSTASAAFFLTSWQLFHDVKGVVRPIDLWSLGLSTASIGCALAIFWPITYHYTSDLKIEPKYASTLKRVKVEGLVWIILWLSATAISVVATISGRDNPSTPLANSRMKCVIEASSVTNAPGPLIFSCRSDTK